ncbi:interleukin-5-like [Harpia harpyja]|uniref:Interleukin-5 n=1 Tax=Aquila chrysaetos chrysaetos TaxID=223781 RepID=A0A663F7A9_AQUCH|nr:interleukin-5-like [Aquila chrysaetos chrysaetos]XP_052628188.1 interleukin-5-like [Harpia harpyja]
MKIHLYILLLAASISAAPQMSNMAELQILLQQMCESMTKDIWNLRIETPDNIDDVNCISTIFEGTEQLKTNPAMKKFSVFFQKFERLKQLLTPSLAKEGKCDTERKNATIFLEKLMTFIRKVSKTARA